MSKRKKKVRFSDVWKNQTELGRAFGLSAVAMGKKLVEFGLRDTGTKQPTEHALGNGYAKFTPLKDGTPFWMWNYQKVSELMVQSGAHRLSEGEQEALKIAEDLIALDREAEKTGLDKLFYLYLDGVPGRLKPFVNKWLKKKGASFEI